jgi:ectoine hydroxylase-related dioxygenase (phytanoyl-CoA dioxygenase family)
MNHFLHCGYLLLPTRLPDDVVEGLKEAIRKDIDAEVEPVVRDTEGRPVRVSGLLDRHPVFEETGASDAVVGPLSSLLGPNILMLRNRHNHATMNFRSHKRDDFHRDNVQWSRGLLTVIFYLEDTTVENGCTEVVPGTHLLPGVEELHRLADISWIDNSGLLDQAVPVPVQAGQMMAIDSTIFHRAGSNSTDGSRMSMTIGYQSVDELADAPDPTRTLISGEHIYMGNDRKKL